MICFESVADYPNGYSVSNDELAAIHEIMTSDPLYYDYDVTEARETKGRRFLIVERRCPKYEYALMYFRVEVNGEWGVLYQPPVILVDGVPTELDPDHYITVQTVKHLRCFDEGDGWALDASDGAGYFTREIWKYDTREEALSHKDEFIEFLREMGHKLPEGEIAVVEEPEGGGVIL